MVSTRNIMLFKLVCKNLMSPVILAYEKRSCSVHIDPVDDSRAEHPVYAGKAAATVIEHCIYQCVAVMPGCRMYNHSFWLIYYKNIIILIQNIKRNILGKDIQRFGLRDLYTYLIAGIYLIIRFDRFSVYQYSFLFYKFLDIRTGKVLKICTQKSIDPFPLVFCCKI